MIVNLCMERNLIGGGVIGTYHSGRPIIKISNFAPTLSVITSKQRPRRFGLKGSDGRDYQYCLKGNPPSSAVLADCAEEPL